LRKWITVILVIVAVLAYGVYWSFFDMDRLPKGELVAEAEAPGGKYTIRAYVSDMGATTDFAILGELNYNLENKKPRNIYWNYHESTANIEWIDAETVNINGHRINVLHDTYDFRRQ